MEKPSKLQEENLATVMNFFGETLVHPSEYFQKLEYLDKPANGIKMENTFQ